MHSTVHLLLASPDHDERQSLARSETRPCAWPACAGSTARAQTAATRARLARLALQLSPTSRTRPCTLPGAGAPACLGLIACRCPPVT
jgi:hypothetical protein